MRKVNSTQILNYLNQKLDEQYTPEAIEAERDVLILLKLIPENYPYKEKVLSLMTNEVAGFYDPDRGKFFIAEKTPSHLLEPVLNHELTHALQDQHFNLRKIMNERDRENDDRSLAASSLFEGEALLVMGSIQAQEKHAVDVSQESLDPFKGIPNIMIQSLLFPYVHGLSFVQTILKKKGWEGVNDLYQNLPNSSEQILHPEKYPTDRPIEIPTTDLNAQKFYTNVMGEFGVQQIFENRLSQSRAAQIAEGWGGDRYWLITNKNGKKELIWKLVWDHRRDADEFEKGWKDIFPKSKLTRFTLKRPGSSPALLSGTSLRLLSE